MKRDIMKKIINGKRYDTVTATRIAHYDNGLGYSDFSNCNETLFLTPKCAWFTVGSGGPMSRYARRSGNNSTTGSVDVFMALTADAAREWLERHGETAALEEHWAHVIEDA